MLAELSIHPIGQGVSISAQVARAVEVIEKSGLPFRLTPLGTVIEGEWDEVMQVIRDCRNVMAADCERLLIRITIDDRKGATGRLTENQASVEKALGRSVQT